MILENEMFNNSSLNTMISDSASSVLFCGTPEPESGRRTMASYPSFSNFQEEPFNDFHLALHDGMIDTDNGWPFVGNFSDGNSFNNEDLNGAPVSAFLDIGTSKSLAPIHINFESEMEMLSCEKNINVGEQVRTKLNHNEVLDYHRFPGNIVSNVEPSYNVVGRSEPNLSLSENSYINTPHTCSKMNCSKESRYSDHPDCNGLGSKLNFPGNLDSKEWDCVPTRPVCFSNVLLGSRYLHVAQQALVEFARFALEDQNVWENQVPDKEQCEARVSFSSGCCTETGFPSMQISCYGFKHKKMELSSMLQTIDKKIQWLRGSDAEYH